MDKIKVCHIITKLELGGAQGNTLFTVSNIDRDKFIPVLITGKGGILDKDASEIKNLKIYFISSVIRKIKPCRDFLGFYILLKILLKERPMIVHTHSSKAGILGRWAAFFAGVPVIIHTVHGFGFNDFQNPLVRNIFVFAEKITALITKKLIVVTKEDKNKGIKNGIGTEDKYAVIRSGIDTKFYKNVIVDKEKIKKELNIPSEEKVITTIGPFKPQKNLRDFIRVAKNISEKYEKCSFLIIGDGEEKKELEFLIYALKMTNKIKMLGWRNDIAELLRITDVFIMTSLWEGLPKAILEAMCLKVPVVANAVDGVKEIIKNGENGFLFRPFENELMAESVIKLLLNKKMAALIGEKGFESINEEFDINYMVKQQEILYINIINSLQKKT